MNGVKQMRHQNYRFVVDNNFVQRGGMREFLLQSPLNIAILTETVLIEWHKRNAAETARRRFDIICQFPSQFLILKSTSKLIKMSGRSKGLLKRLVDEKQTSELPAYCRLNIDAPLDSPLSSAFYDLELQAAEQVSGLSDEGTKIFRLFSKFQDDLGSDANELRQLTKNSDSLPENFQIRIFQFAGIIAGAMLKKYNPPKPRDLNEFVNTLAFRYAAMVIGKFLIWQEHSGTAPTNKKSLLNDVMDLKIAAQATYFHGLKTYETKLDQIFNNGISLIRALGGYTSCGQQQLLK